MDTCPKCDITLVQFSDELFCPRCGYHRKRWDLNGNGKIYHPTQKDQEKTSDCQ